MKRCNICYETKPLDSFHRHKNMRDGRLNQCKTCYVKKYSRSRQERRRAVTVSDKWTFDALPTMTRRDIIRWAASRYALVDPSPDDILSRRWHRYDTGDRIHVEGYHADYEEVLRVAVINDGIQLCKVCSKDITGLNRNRRYCGPKCQREADKLRHSTGERKSAARTTEEERKQIVEWYIEGLTLLEIQARSGRSHSAIHYALEQSGIERRKASKQFGMGTLNLGAA